MRDVLPGLRVDWSAIRAGGAGTTQAAASEPLEQPAVDALVGRRVLLVDAEPIQLQLESKADGEFASKHGALAARARSKPWEDWDEKEQDEMRAFLDVKVHVSLMMRTAVGSPACAPFPQFEAPDSKSTADPQADRAITCKARRLP